MWIVPNIGLYRIQTSKQYPKEENSRQALNSAEKNVLGSFFIIFPIFFLFHSLLMIYFFLFSFWSSNFSFISTILPLYLITPLLPSSLLLLFFLLFLCSFSLFSSFNSLLVKGSGQFPSPPECPWHSQASFPTRWIVHDSVILTRFTACSLIEILSHCAQ